MYRILSSLCGWLLKNVPLIELAHALEVLSVRLFEHRMSHHGFVPLTIFHACVGMGGSMPNFEVVVRIAGNHGSFALKKRGEGESGWVGKHHIVGANCLITDGPNDVFLRFMVIIILP